MPTPATQQNLRDERELTHADCNGDIHFYYYHVSCNRCRRQWQKARIRGWSDAMVGSTFNVKPIVERDAVALVWVTDPQTKRRYMSCRPLADVAKYERVKL